MASTAVAHPERMRHGCNFWRKNVISLVFFVFNLIPVYPLDGFMAVDALKKHRDPFYDF